MKQMKKLTELAPQLHPLDSQTAAVGRAWAIQCHAAALVHYSLGFETEFLGWAGLNARWLLKQLVNTSPMSSYFTEAAPDTIPGPRAMKERFLCDRKACLL